MNDMDKTCQYDFDDLDLFIASQYASGMMTTHQCRAARALLGWSQEKLAREAHVGVVTVRTFEAGRTQPVHATLKAMRDALDTGGVEFIDANGGGPGVRLKDSASREK